MEHEDAMGAVVGDSGARKVEQWFSEDGNVQSIYVNDELVFVADRSSKHKLDLEARTTVMSLRAVLAERDRELLEIKGPCSNKVCSFHYAHSGPCAVYND